MTGYVTFGEFLCQLETLGSQLGQQKYDALVDALVQRLLSPPKKNVQKEKKAVVWEVWVKLLRGALKIRTKKLRRTLKKLQRLNYVALELRMSDNYYYITPEEVQGLLNGHLASAIEKPAPLSPLPPPLYRRWVVLSPQIFRCVR